MHLARRTLLQMMAAQPLLAGAIPAMADQGPVLFWRVARPDLPIGIIFGYDRIPAETVPDIVKDGWRMVDSTARVIHDLDNVTNPQIGMSKTDEALLPKLSKSVGDELRALFPKDAFPVEIDRMPGFLIMMALMSEGAQPMQASDPTVAGVIMDRARALGRPETFLLGTDEARSVILIRSSEDMSAFNRRLDDRIVARVLELRRRVGPLGAYTQQLYRQRQSDETERWLTGLQEAGLGMLCLFDIPRFKELVASHLPNALAASPAEPFMMFALALLYGPDGILARLSATGFTITRIA
jgi:hypothetical protein